MSQIVKTYIENQNWSQAQFAKRVGLPQPMVSNLVSGKYSAVSLNVIQKLRKAMGVSADALIDDIMATVMKVKRRAARMAKKSHNTEISTMREEMSAEPTVVAVGIPVVAKRGRKKKVVDSAMTTTPSRRGRKPKSQIQPTT